MADYRWVITKDLIDTGAEDTEGPSDLDPTIMDNPGKFAMYDGDGECYYEGMIYGDYSGFEPLDDFGMFNAGCTEIKIDGVTLWVNG